MIKTHNVCTKMSLFYNVKEILAHTTTGSFIEPFGYYMYQVWSKNLLEDIINFCKPKQTRSSKQIGRPKSRAL